MNKILKEILAWVAILGIFVATTLIYENYGTGVALGYIAIMLNYWCYTIHKNVCKKRK